MLIRAFAGMRPIVHPMNLEDGQAADCVDCVFTSTGLEPVRALALVEEGFAGVQTLFRIGENVVGIHQAVDLVRSPVIRDVYDRVYFTLADEALESDLYVTTSGELAAPLIPARRLRDLVPPESAPVAYLMKDGQVVTVYTQEVYDAIQSGEVAGRPVPGSGGEVVMAETLEKYTAFRVSFVTDYGEETALSPASAVVGYKDLENYGFRLVNVPVSEYPWVVKRRIYMEVDGEYYRIAEIDNNTDVSVDLYPLDDDAIGDIQETDDFDPAPEDLRGLVGLPCGALAGFTNQGETGTVHVSEAFQPHAWPVGYRFKSLYAIVALAVVPEGLLVVTQGKPLLIVGAYPAVMQAQVIESTQSCSSSRSLVVLDGMAAWACPDGVAVYGGGLAVQVLSRGVWSREQWRELQPASMLFAVYERYLLIFAEASAWLYSLDRHDVCRLSMATGVMDDACCAEVFSPAALRWAGGGGLEVRCWLYDILTDRLLLVVDGRLVAFNEGEPLRARWIGKELVQANAKPWSRARVEADGYPVLLSLLADDVRVFGKAVLDNRLLAVGSTGRKRRVQVGLETRQRVKLLQLAHDAREVA